MAFVLSHDRRAISNGDLLEDMQRVAYAQGDTVLKQRTYKEHGKYGVTTVIRRFGGWNEAVKEAGLATSVERNVPDEKLFGALYALWVSLGRQPSYAEVRAPLCIYNISTFERRFGSWRQALEAFVAYTQQADLRAAESPSPPMAMTRRRTSRIADLRLRFRVMARDHFRCVACGATPAVTPGVQLNVDHITPWSRGGETLEDNLQTLCMACNQGKSNAVIVRAEA